MSSKWLTAAKWAVPTVLCATALLRLMSWLQPDAATQEGEPPTSNQAANQPHVSGSQSPAESEELKPPKERGISAKDYESVFTSKGEYQHKDCSDFELSVARSMMKQLNASEEDEEKITARVAREFQLRPKMVLQIYAKAITDCDLHP